MVNDNFELYNAKCEMYDIENEFINVNTDKLKQDDWDKAMDRLDQVINANNLLPPPPPSESTDDENSELKSENEDELMTIFEPIVKDTSLLFCDIFIMDISELDSICLNMFDQNFVDRVVYQQLPMMYNLSITVKSKKTYNSRPFDKKYKKLISKGIKKLFDYLN